MGFFIYVLFIRFLKYVRVCMCASVFMHVLLPLLRSKRNCDKSRQQIFNVKEQKQVHLYTTTLFSFTPGRDRNPFWKIYGKLTAYNTAAK